MSGIIAEQAMLRQNIALEVIKQSAEQDRAIANILEESTRSAPVSSSKGVNLNTSA